MKPIWKTYLFYASLFIIGGGFIFILVQTIRLKITGFETKTLWDWMELLIIPLVLSLGAFFLNRSERAVERQIADDRKKEDRELADERAELERQIAKDHQQEAALQAYINRLSELLLKEKLRTTKRKEVSDVARTLTVSVLRGLDKDRKNLVIQFLREANLITNGNSILNGANMEGIDLHGLNLGKVYLQGAILTKANMQDVYMEYAKLQGTYLDYANLQGSLLAGAKLQGACLDDANLTGAHMPQTNLNKASLGYVNMHKANLAKANLQEADLGNANLQNAYLEDANLQGAHLEEANLQGARLGNANLQAAILVDAIVNAEQLARAKSLKGATMPDGTIHE